MSWTNPRTWVTNEVVTSALLNTHIRDNLLAASHPYDFSSNDVEVTNTTNETSIWSKLISGGALGATGRAELVMEGDFLRNSPASTLTLRVKFGGSPILGDVILTSGNVSTTRLAWMLEVWVTNRSSTSSQLVTARLGWDDSNNANTMSVAGVGDFSTGTSGLGQNTASVDTSADQTFDVTVQWSGASTNNAWRKRLAVLRLAQN